MEKKFNNWSLTTKNVYFCKLDANRMGPGKEWKDSKGRDGINRQSKNELKY